MSRDLRVPGNVTLLHLPPYSPELNPVERVWSYLKSHYLSNQVFTDYADLMNRATDGWNAISQTRLQSICKTAWVETVHVAVQSSPGRTSAASSA